MSATAAIDALAERALADFPIVSARAIEGLEPAEIAGLLAELEPKKAAAVLVAMAPLAAREAHAALEPDDAAAALAALEPTGAASLLRGAPTDRVDRLLGLLEPKHRAAIARSLSFAAKTAGALAEPSIALSVELAADAALAALRSRGRAGDLVCAVDRNGAFAGAAELAEVVAAPPDSALGTLLDPQVPAVEADEGLGSLADHPGWSRWRALPVIDSGGRLVGVLRLDRVRAVSAEGPRASSAVTLPVSIAELLWLGLSGMVDGLANVVDSQKRPDER